MPVYIVDAHPFNNLNAHQTIQTSIITTFALKSFDEPTLSGTCGLSSICGVARPLKMVGHKYGKQSFKRPHPLNNVVQYKRFSMDKDPSSHSRLILPISYVLGQQSGLFHARTDDLSVSTCI